MTQTHIPSPPQYAGDIRKRDGSLAAFNAEKIEHAVRKALVAAKEEDGGVSERIAKDIARLLVERESNAESAVPHVEEIQDEVEKLLMHYGKASTAKAYILYRARHASLRFKRGTVPTHVQALTNESKKYFAENPLGEFVYLRTYARWIEEEKRRETWIETVDRYLSFMKENVGEALTEEEYAELRAAILKQEVMPSMRLMQFAGAPARRCNTCAYNCTYIAPTALRDFSEIMYLSMQGCGVGFSAESQNVEQLPQIARKTTKKREVHTVADTKEGWCDALLLGLETWYAGEDIDFDFSEIRPAGARLRTMGGKASGPEPLRSLLSFAREKIQSRSMRRLRAIDVHDIICKIGECVVAGGVRRTAMISLSDLDDVDMRDAKKGQFYLNEPYRAVSNNSAVYAERPNSTELLEEWLALLKSGSGERGIFNRGALAKTLPERRKEHFEKVGFIGPEGVVEGPIGTNPCGEIILQSKQFCNLSEVIARESDTAESLQRKVRLAAMLGTYQSSLTEFRYISPEWQEHCAAERLLGVSITGQWDSDAARDPKILRTLRAIAIATNKEYAERLGITQSLAVTAVKPSGTVSQTFNCSSGIHPRHAEYYIRRVRISATDSLFHMMKDQGVPFHPEVGQSAEQATTYVLEFPVRAPEGARCKDDFTALDQLEHWKNIKLNYTEHNPSATISIGDDEWISVVDWVQRNWDIVGGLSFLPRFDHVYQLAPYEAIAKEEYEKRLAAFPAIDYSKLMVYEQEDETEQKRELACAGGTCEIESIPEEATKQ